MEFQNKYTSLTDKDLIENKDKKIISDDAFALGDVIQEFINKINDLKMFISR